MCTVSYLPLTSGGYILTSNRDEAPQRKAIDLRKWQTGGQTLLYPVDPGAGGSWFGISDQGRAACVLNGAFEPYIPTELHTHSRGIVLLDLLTSESLTTFATEYDFSKTAPFTIVLIDGHLHELIWDGTTLRVTELSADVPAFWSSVTLYPEDVRKWRKSLFQQWKENHPVFRQEDIIDCHRYGSKADAWNGFVMNRNERVRTLSITSALFSDRRFTLIHDDLMSDERCTEILELQSADVAED
jgi:hypothetical protein